MAHPPWHFDRQFVNTHGLAVLPGICVLIGTGNVIVVTGQPVWWPFPKLATAEAELAREAIRLGHGLHLGARVVMHMQTRPGADNLLSIHRRTGEWCQRFGPDRGEGPDLIELVARRLDCSAASAAWRIARLARLPHPWPEGGGQAA